MSSNASDNVSQYYYPQPSHWPITASIAVFLTLMGLALIIHDLAAGPIVMIAGILVLAYMMFGWFGNVVAENQLGKYNKQVDSSFRWGMSWFIFSEVAFFISFFCALYYARYMSVPDLAETQTLLWPEFIGTWPTAGPGFTETFQPMAAWGLPAINTILLLSSGATITWAHWGLVAGKRSQLVNGLILTILLGVTFLGLQAYEYIHAYQELNLKFSTGIYGATFFILTGFHGLHVTIGAIMLMAILARAIKGHFSADNHFAFEAVAWYWHFVDVVWVLLFILVYWM